MWSCCPFRLFRKCRWFPSNRTACVVEETSDFGHFFAMEAAPGLQGCEAAYVRFVAGSAAFTVKWLRYRL